MWWMTRPRPGGHDGEETSLLEVPVEAVPPGAHHRGTHSGAKREGLEWHPFGLNLSVSEKFTRVEDAAWMRRRCGECGRWRERE
jgi:hypothetical protein